ncbi:hypothetical protein, partial [Paenibacillus sp. sgz500958]|uniref:hypothetical protein n=1 Tax=Paenibacillus sp. sgz500958 TaxID=3242475 RepID=UPI0036D35A6B
GRQPCEPNRIAAAPLGLKVLGFVNAETLCAIPETVINHNKTKEKSMKKLIVIAFITMVIFVGFIYFHNNKEPDSSLIYDKNLSNHSGFRITEENKVVITENIHIINPTKKRIRFMISANFSKDFQDGLVKQKYLKGYISENEKDNIFELESSTERDFIIYFIGEAGSKMQKHDRNPPENVLIKTVDE